MDMAKKNFDFNCVPWVDKSNCNNNNITEGKDINTQEDVEGPPAHYQRQNNQPNSLPAIELASTENVAAEDREHADGSPKITENGATNDAGSSNEVLPARSTPNSNRTSVNSTDNLSYNSDNYYVDELIVLQNTLSDEDLSLNSDDCIYAYRGGNDFDVTLENRNNNIEDETDFLEMDFDPDPSSEVDPSTEFRSLQYPPISMFSNSLSDDAVMSERQLFSSPVENGETVLCHRCPTNKNFANLSLNLTQIQSTPNADGDCAWPATVSYATEGSKPKITGAKPKRIVDRNISIMKNRKTPVLYSKMNKSCGTAISLCSTGSLDERSSANGFQQMQNENAFNRREHSDETCLDCLEKEFLANTIGKPIEWAECPKCKNKHPEKNLSIAKDNSCSNGQSSSSTVSGTNSILGRKMQSSSLSFDLGDISRAPSEISAGSLEKESTLNDCGDSISTGEETSELNIRHVYSVYRDRSTCDIFEDERILKRPDTLFSRISTLNVDEHTVSQALEKLKVTFNKELVSSYFRFKQTEFKNLKQFILHHSLRNCNHYKLKRLIELACNNTVSVKYKPDNQISHVETIQIPVADVLQQWRRNNDLESLKYLSKPFFESNTLGKIIYIIRQAQYRSNTQQRSDAKPIAEFISIPQYYKSGYISITKK